MPFPIARPGQGNSTWDAIKLGGELPGPGGMAAEGSSLASGALSELVNAIRSGKATNPAAVKALLREITGVMGKSRGAKNLTQVGPDILDAAPLDSTLQMALRGKIPQQAAGGAQKLLGAGSPGGELVKSSAGPLAKMGGALEGEILGEVAPTTGNAATHPGLMQYILGILGGGAAGYGLSQMGGDEEPSGPPLGAELLMRSNTAGKPSTGRSGARKRPGMPQLPGVVDGLPEELGESFDAPSEEQMEIPQELLQGRNPTSGMSFFDATGGRSSENAMLGDVSGQRPTQKKKSLMQAILGGLGKVF